MSKNDIALSVRGLSKSYTIAHQTETHVTLAEAALARLRNPFRRAANETFWALQDVSFDVKKGEVVGIIGRNGAGKSTLLKILSRITEPTTGQIDLYGRVGSLLEVGTGFHPELTGRENVFLNGAILGMRKDEIRKQFDAIVDFSGTEKFLDTPVKRYSSGMYVRLAFAVAAHLESDIMVIDEVLAVGDLEFQRKCLGKMKDVANSGRTVLFVSHQMQAVNTLCSKAVYMQAGRVAYVGEVKPAVDLYMNQGGATRGAEGTRDAARRRGSGELRFLRIQVDKDTYLSTDDLILDLDVHRFRAGQSRYFVSIEIVNTLGVPILHLDSRLQNTVFDATADRSRIRYTIRSPRLAQGDYRIHAFLCTEGGVMDHYDNATSFSVAPILPYPGSRGNCAGNAMVYPEFSVTTVDAPNASDRDHDYSQARTWDSPASAGLEPAASE